jgi:SAM-dependent methyltransferase
MPPEADRDPARARSFGAVAEDYERARPGYPKEAVTWLLGTRPLEVVDLGAGTGKLTAVLLGAGHRVVAVEPSGALRERLVAALPEARVLEGRAEEVPLPDGSADAVVVGQAFHWFDTEPSLREITRVLRPGGGLGLIWNFRNDTRAWMRELTAVAGEDGLPGEWDARFEARPLVRSVERRDFRLEHRVDREKLLALVRSWSYVSTLGEPERRGILAAVTRLWEQHPDLAGEREAVLTYRTEAYRVRLGNG